MATLIENFRANLSTYDCMVVFTKKNGDLRTMYCTTRPGFLAELNLPERKKDESTPKKSRPENNLCVYDTENNGWRSFSVESVKEFYILDEDGDYYCIYEDEEKLAEGPRA